MRLFFAVDLPLPLKLALAEVQRRATSGDYRWVDPDGMHITLAFLGEQSPDRLETLRQVAEDAAAGVRPSTLSLGQPHIFGRPRDPRVLLIQLQGDIHALQLLQHRLDAGLRSAGFRLEAREYTPHVTLARRRQRARGGSPPGWPPPVPSGTIPLDHIVLFESRLSPRGATYSSVSRIPLEGA
ncbi:MAG: RNA 2',3'-cyclic phosphodiesterase [Chloroflexota bacterium]